MRTLHRRLMCLAVLVVGCGLAGCSSSGTPELTVEQLGELIGGKGVDLV